MTDWAERIPAAIERAEAGPQCGAAAHQTGCDCDISDRESMRWPAATEVALAKALYGEWGEHYSEAEEWLYKALQDFVEKVEAL